MTILVIEDLLPTAVLYKKFLEAEGFEVFLVGECPRAVELLRLNQFDAVILDYCLPGMDGGTLLNILRTDLTITRGKTIPVILVTALSDVTLEDMRESLKKFAPISVFQKPTDFDLIINEIKRLAS